jgi:hypothetical protein
MAVVCQIVCGEIRMDRSDGCADVARFTANLKRCTIPERVIGLPRAFSNNGESGARSICRSQARNNLTVCRQSGTERFLRPLP